MHNLNSPARTPRSPVFLVLLLCGTFFVSAPALAQHAEETHDASDTAAVQAGHDGDHATAADAHGEGENADAHDTAHGAGHTAMPHLPNAISFISDKVSPQVADNLKAFVDPIYSLFVALMLGLFFLWLSRRLSARNPGRTQMAVEMIFGGLYGLFSTIIGPTARRYTPFLGTLFVFIFVNNLFGMVPLGHAATSSFATTTFALGLMTFLFVQGVALKENGLLGYLHHMAGSPKTGMDWGFSLLLFPLHLLGELIKPISLSLRLFGNIFGEDTLVATMVILGSSIVYGLTGSSFVPGLPLQFPFYFLGLLSSTIQALVFTLLATVYIALWLPHGHAEEHGDHAAPASAHDPVHDPLHGSVQAGAHGH